MTVLALYLIVTWLVPPAILLSLFVVRRLPGAGSRSRLRSCRAASCPERALLKVVPGRFDRAALRTLRRLDATTNRPRVLFLS